MASTNPKSYTQLLAAGVSPAQIREAINSGLDPSQLPPEYFGLGGGYTPQSVGPGATPAYELGGIDIPPASMADPYATPAPTQPSGPGFMGAFGTTPNMGFPSDFSLGGTPPSSTTDYLGMPGYSGPAYDPGSMGGFSTTPNFGFPSDFGLGSTPSSTYSYMGIPGSYDPSYTPDSSGVGFAGSGALSYADPTPIPFSDPISASTGGDMNLGGYSTTPTGAAGMQFGTDPSAGGTIGDFSYTPQPGLNYYDAGGGTTYVYDSDWNYLYTTTGGSAGSALGSVSSDPFAGAASAQQSAGGGIAGGAGAAGGITGGAGIGGGGITPAGYYSQFGSGATYSYPTGLGLGGLDPSTGGYMSVGGGAFAKPTTAVAEGGDPAGGNAEDIYISPEQQAAIDAQQAARTSALATLGSPTGFQWKSTPGFSSGFSQKGVGFGQTKVDQAAAVAQRGYWNPVWSPTQQALLQSIGLPNTYLPQSLYSSMPTTQRPGAGGGFVPFTSPSSLPTTTKPLGKG